MLATAECLSSAAVASGVTLRAASLSNAIETGLPG